MRFSQFRENQALADAAKVIEKNFSPERAAIKDKVVALIRDIQMGKGDKMQQAMELTALTKSELEAKRSDPDLTVGVDLNVGMMKRAMSALTDVNESITEEELEEYKSISSLRNDQMFRALARLQDKKAEKGSPVKKIEVPKQLDLFKANEAREIDPKKMQAYMDFKKEKDIDGSSVRMAVDNPDLPETKRLMTNDDFAKAVKMYKSALKESAEPQAITEEEFDVLAEKKDACYHKVKSRYKVWPSAYASGALVKCRKVGAANWGNSKKK